MDSTQNAELERKVQELFTANRKVELLNANVEHLEHENECLRKTIEDGSKLLEEARKNEGKSKNDALLRQNIADLKQELQESQELEKTLREDNVRLEKRLQQVLENSVANISCSGADLDTEEILALNAELLQVRTEKTKLQAELLTLSENLQQQTDEKTRLRQEILEKEEELECIESQFSTQCDISERLREENCELKEQLESENGQVNVAKKGNSLFSEVDDRRVAAESRVVQIHEQLKSLEEVLTNEQKENKRLKTQITFLRHNTKKGFDEDAVIGLQTQLVQAKKTIADLTEKLATLEMSPKPSPVTEYRKSASALASDDDKRYITFLEGLIRTKTKEVSELKSQAHSSHQQSVRTDLYLTQAKNELQMLRHEVMLLKQRNSHLSVTLQDLKHKYGEDSPARASLSITEYFCSLSVNFLLALATGNSMPSLSCMRAAPSPRPDAYVLRMNLLSRSGNCRTGFEFTANFKELYKPSPGCHSNSLYWAALYPLSPKEGQRSQKNWAQTLCSSGPAPRLL
ncbi:protein Spindly [Elysia marginata]|uniref:Protein Spindly n=1 Tax=Elysia marginata TaxID=1093978 RepID=A0AAV4ESK1_9GAST|nr:protein Spindly [Elysia marginata]